MQPKAIFGGTTKFVPRGVRAASVDTSDITFNIGGFKTVSVVGVPVDANNKDSGASLSLGNFTSSDPTVLTVAPDPNTPNGAIISFVGDGTATLSESATASDVSSGPVSGDVVITLTSTATGVTVAISFVFGNPQ